MINGFGKSVGLVQVDELGTLETPIALTNTFGVSALAQAQIRAAIRANPRIGREWSTVNPLVFEFNDGYLNDIQALAVTEQHFNDAFDAASRDSAAAAAANAAADTTAGKPERGSIIMIVATDAPLDARQLKRLSLRAAAGVARTGSVYGHGRGDIALAFSTGYTEPHGADFVAPPSLVAAHCLDPLFRACADSGEQAILNALWSAETVTGRDGHRRLSLRDSVPDLAELLRNPAR